MRIRTGLRSRWKLVTVCIALGVLVLGAVADTALRIGKLQEVETSSLIPDRMPIPESMANQGAEPTPYGTGESPRHGFALWDEAWAGSWGNGIGFSISVQKYRYPALASKVHSDRKQKLFYQFLSNPTMVTFGSSVADKNVLVCTTPRGECDGMRHYLMQVGQYFVELGYRGTDHISEEEFMEMIDHLEAHIEDVLQIE